MSFATRLKKLRLTHNVTQQELADYLNVTRPTIAGYETKGKEPDYQTLSMISAYFDVSVDYLLTGRNYPESQITEEDTDKAVMGYEDFLILRDDVKPKVSILIERTQKMDTYDVDRLLEYASLLLYQPKYNQKQKDE